MLDYAQFASPYNSKETTLIIENMLDKFSIEYQMRNNDRNSSSSSASTTTNPITQSIGSSAVTVEQCDKSEPDNNPLTKMIHAERQKEEEQEDK